MTKEGGPQIAVSMAQKQDGGTQIIITPDNASRRILVETALKRGKTIPSMVAEALRAEGLLANGELYVRNKGSVDQLIGV